MFNNEIYFGELKMKCLEVTKLISDAQERPLLFGERIGMQTHLLFCPHCRHFKQHCEQMSKLMKKFADGK